jgi:sugar phosphate isomerase/epimerase
MPSPTLSLAIGPIMAAMGKGAGRRSPSQLGAALDMAAAAGCRHVQLSAADPLTKPRSLDRSAVRDIAANVRRRGLACSGVDLFVPHAHILSSETVDQAAEALADAARFASELASLTGGEPILATALPRGSGGEAGGGTKGNASLSGVVDALAASAMRAGATVADHTAPHGAWRNAGIMDGLDPAAVFLKTSGGPNDPGEAAAALARAGTLVACRASDLTDEGRVPPGQGSLDPLAYTVALMTAFRESSPPPLVLDTRGLDLPTNAASLQGFVERLAATFGGSPAA